MPDVFAHLTEADPAILDGIINALELRAADPQQRAMLETYLTHRDDAVQSSGA
jgi:hypothetical protein